MHSSFGKRQREYRFGVLYKHSIHFLAPEIVKETLTVLFPLTTQLVIVFLRCSALLCHQIERPLLILSVGRGCSIC